MDDPIKQISVKRKARIINESVFSLRKSTNVFTRTLSEEMKVPRALTVPFPRGGWFLATSTDLDFVCRAARGVYEPSPARQKR